MILIRIFRPVRKGVSKQTSEESNSANRYGKRLLYAGVFAGGHPDIIEKLQPCYVLFSELEMELGIVEKESASFFVKKGAIPLQGISSIRVEDPLTFKVKLSTAEWKERVNYLECLAGVDISQVAFIIIEWKRSETSYHTCLCIQSRLAMETALKIRNDLVYKFNSIVKASHV
jgi:hypothetical protein